MAITAKPFNFLNQQTNLPVSGFNAITTDSILNQSYPSPTTSGPLSSLSSSLCSIENAASSALSSIGSLATGALSAVGGALSSAESAVGGFASNMISDISSAINSLSCSSSSLSPTSLAGGNPLTGGLSNIANSGNNVFSQGNYLGNNSIGSLILAPTSSVASSVTNILGGLGGNISSSLSSFSGQCLNMLLNNLNQMCNFGTPYLGNFGNGYGYGCVSQLSGLLGSIVGNNAAFPISNMCNEYRMLVGLTQTATQAGIPGVFNPLSSTFNNPMVTNAAGPTLFRYGVQNQSFSLLSELGSSPAVGSISSTIPNAPSLISQSYNSGLSTISQNLSGVANNYDSVLNSYNPSSLSGSITGSSIPNISNLMSSVPSVSSLLQTTMSSPFSKSSLVNSSMMSATRTPLGSILGSQNNSIINSQNILNPLSGGSTSISSSTSTSSGSTSTASAQNVGIGSSQYTASNVQTNTGFTNIVASSSTSSQSTSQQSSSVVQSILGGSGSGSTTTVSNTISTSSSQSTYQQNASAAQSVLGGSGSGGSGGVSTASIVGTTNSSILAAYRNRTLNKSVNISDVLSNPTAPAGTFSANDHSYMAMQGAALSL